MTELECMVGRDERVFWKGTPDKKCFILESIFNPLLPIAAIWLLIDCFIIGAGFQSGKPEIKILIVLFMLLHLMPVWIYIAGVLLSVRKYKRTQYIVTDRGIYVSAGMLAFSSTMKPFAELSNIEIHRGIIDQKLGVGDIIITGCRGSLSASSAVSDGVLILKDLGDYQRVYGLIKQLQSDIYADTMYPNDLRPETNHGYKTKYQYEEEE